MKKPVPYIAVLVFTSLFLSGYPAVGVADGLSIRIGEGHHNRSFGHHSYGPVISFGRSYGPVTSLGGRHRLSGRNQYNLSITRSGLRLIGPRHDTFRGHDRLRYKSRHHGYSHGYRDGFRDGRRYNRFLRHRWKH